MRYVSHNAYDYIIKQDNKTEEGSMLSFIFGFIVGGILGFIGCSFLSMLRDD